MLTGLMCLAAALFMWRISQTKMYTYSCPGCGTKDDEHLPDCHFRK